LTTLAYLHWNDLRLVVGSDVDPAVLPLAARNLALLTPAGIGERIARLAELCRLYLKPSHADALASARCLEARLAALRATHDVPARVARADATNDRELLASLGRGAVDVVMTDLPYGQRSRWLVSEATTDPLRGLLEALRPVLAPRAVVAVASDKAQRPAHEAYERIERLQIGKRQVTLLTPRD